MLLNRKIAMACAALLAALTLAGCNTVEGMGEDIQGGGRAVEKAANHNR